MPASFKVLPHRSLILFTYWGNLTLVECQQVVVDAMQDPRAEHSMRHLCDVSAVTEIERNPVALMQMQSRIVESLDGGAQYTMVVFYAPSKPGLEMAQMARKSWEGLDRAIVLVQETESGTLALLGLPERSLSDLKAMQD